jgi:adenylate cyclase, class 2
MMNYEVEQKFAAADLAAVEARLAELGAVVAAAKREVDEYYAHPARDFAVTDEALRIRSVTTEAGEAVHRLTYKGPKIDTATKTRRELELPLERGTAPDWAELLAVLGFRPVAAVRKRRRKAQVAWQGRHVEVSLDEVEQVGTYVELELIAPAEEVDQARACIASLAQKLALSGSERRSYLALLLGRCACSPMRPGE